MPTNRRGPAAPSPAMRSNSTQSLPRSSTKGKQTPNSRTTTSQFGNGHSPSSKTSSGATSSKAKRSKRTISRLTTLSLFLLQALSLYAFFACPAQQNVATPLCRSVRVYKTTVLDPYILPPIYSALSHPSAQPYVQQAQALHRQAEPYITTTMKVAQPVAEQIGSLTLKSKRIVWDGIVVPQFVKLVVPQYDKYLAPHVNQAIVFYQIRVAPHVDRVQSFVIATYTTLKPYGQRFYAVAKPFSIRLWLNAKPQLIKLWSFIRPYLLQAWAHILRFLGVVAHEIGDARKQYVDPHITTIWKKAAELSRNESSASSVDTSTSLVSQVSETTDPVSRSVADSTPSSTPISSVAHPSPSIPTRSTTVTVDEPTSSNDPSSSSEVVSSIEEVSSSIAVDVPDASASAEADSPPEPIPDAEVSSKEPESESQSSTSDAVPPPEPDQDGLDDLFGDLEDAPPVQNSKLTPQDRAASAEEQARLKAEKDAEELRKKKEETATKRRDIVDRHANWERKLNEHMEINLKEFREALDAHREAHLGELVGKYEGDKETSGSFVRGLVDGSLSEAERLLAGLESFLTRATKGMELPDFDVDVHLKKWDKAASRVRDKFQEDLQKAQEGIFQWYSNMRNWEINQVLAIEEKANDIASEGQLDLGMDYAWLDDVSYKDWKRYHDLVRTAKSFGEEIRAIQNGTHANPPADPIRDAMEGLQQEMEEIIMGFESAWRSIRVHGVNTLSEPITQPEAEPEFASQSVTVEEPAAEPEPEVSILPVSGDAEEIKKTDPDAFIGRSESEVREAAERAEPHLQHVEL